MTDYITIYSNVNIKLQKIDKRKNKCKFKNGDCYFRMACQNSMDYIEYNKKNCNNNAKSKNRYY